MTPDVLDRLIRVLSDFSGADNLSAASTLSDLGMDSLETLATATAIENEFSVELGDDVIIETSTVGELAEYVEARIKAKEAIAGAVQA